jgi:hypothetical protein
MVDAPNVASGTRDPKPEVFPAAQPKENPKPSADDRKNDEESPPAPLSPELLPIGDPASAA